MFVDCIVAKKCDHCGTAMYIRKTNDNPIPTFIGCVPRIVNIRIIESKGKELLIVGDTSTKTVTCQCCGRHPKTDSFKEVKDGLPGAQEKTRG